MSDEPELFRFPCAHEIPMDDYKSGKAPDYCLICGKPKKK